MKKYIQSEILIVNLVTSHDILTTSLTTNTEAIDDVEGGVADRFGVRDDWYEGY